jgi:tetratricopeptide (TPR) repeat protein
MKSLLSIAITLVASLALVAPTLAQRASGGRSSYEIDVQVRFANGAPGPSGIHLVLDSAEGGAEGDCQTREGGRCEFTPMSGGVLEVRLNEPGYKSESARVELIGNSKAFVSIILKPLEDKSNASAAAKPTGNSVSASTLHIPPEANQEFEKGQALLKQNNVDEGIVHVQKAITLYPAYSQAHLLMGSVYLQQRKLADAQSAFEKAIQFDTGLGPAYLELGAVFNQEKEYSKAETVLTHGLELNPNAPEGHYEVAKTYWALGRWQDAEPHARKASELQPAMAPVHVILGNIDLRKHDVNGALKEFQQYLAMDPKGPMAESVQGMVKRIQDALEHPD